MKNEKQFELTHRLKRAQEFEGGGKILHAIQLYQAIIDDFPDDTTAWFRLIEIYENMGKMDSVLGVMEELIEHLPDELEVKLFTGHFYFKYQKWEESIAVLNGVDIESEPIAFFILGLAFFHTGNFKDAATHLVSFVNFEKNSSFLGESYLYIARCYLELNQKHVALPYLEEASKLAPTNPEVYFYQAVYYFSIGMYAHASTQVSVALELGTENRQIFELAVEIYEKNGEFNRIEALCNKYIEQGEPSPKIYTYLAKVFLMKNKYRDASVYLETALKLNPNYQQAKDVLKELTERRDNDLVKDI
ncbi:hypothetical protein MASR1M107_29550 [Ignavibacteriales bacterium]